jgi:hypothetical protein
MNFDNCDKCNTCPDNHLSALYRKSALLRVFHGVPGGPKIDVEIDHVKKFFEKGYKDDSNYIPVAPGTRKITIKFSGSNDTISWKEFEILPGTPYTVVIQGLLTEKNEFKLKFNLFLDHNITPDDDYSQVRFIHLSPKSPVVDVYTSNILIFTNVNYGHTSLNNPYKQLLANSQHELFIKQADIHELNNHDNSNSYNNNNNSNGNNIIDSKVIKQGDNKKEPIDEITLLGPLSFEPIDKYVYTIFSVGIYGDKTTPLEAVVVKDWPYIVQEEDDNQIPPIVQSIPHNIDTNNNYYNNNNINNNSSIRFIHTMSSPINVEINGNPFITNMGKNKLSENVLLPSNQRHRITVKDNEDNQLYFDDNVPFKNEKKYTFVLKGKKSNPSATIHQHAISKKPHLYIINLRPKKISGYCKSKDNRNKLMFSADSGIKRDIVNNKIPIIILKDYKGNIISKHLSLTPPKKGMITLFVGDDCNFVSYN